LTLFWPIHFLGLQQQNSSALGVEVNPGSYSYSRRFEMKKIWLFSFGDDILLSRLITTVEANLRTS